MLGGIGIPELLIILLIILIIFGAGRLPQIGRSLGKGLKEFQEAVKGNDESTKEKKEEGDR
ncbi:MAG: twin-arginine translocase TatA/TatE family subunit [bacterium]|nr:twin-arginine translocase TatA/TatE family subunit [bacterium]